MGVATFKVSECTFPDDLSEYKLQDKCVGLVGVNGASSLLRRLRSIIELVNDWPLLGPEAAHCVWS